MSYKKSKTENGETRYVASTNELEHLVFDSEYDVPADVADFLNGELLAMYQVQKWLLSSIKEISSVLKMYELRQEELPRTNASCLRDETLEMWKTVHHKLFEVYNFATQEYEFDGIKGHSTEPRDTIRSMVESQDHLDNLRKAFGEEIPLAPPKYLEAMGEVLAKQFKL